LGSYDDPKIAREVLRRYGKWPAADKAEAILMLTGRRTTAEALFSALKSGAIAKRDVSAYSARQLQRVLGPAFVDFWGPLSRPSQEKREEIERWKRTLTDEVVAKANPRQGRVVFERTCS